MLDLDQFENTLRETGGYTTPRDSLPARRMGRGLRAWWCFYVSGILRILLSGLARRQRGGGAPRAFPEMSFETIKAVERTGASVCVEGAGNLRALEGAPCIYVANHSSLLETFHLPCILSAFGPVTVVAKRSLAKYPLFGKCLRAINPILLDRRNPRRDLHDTLEQGKAHVAAGRSVLLFPQGTRSARFNPAKFNSLGAKLAIGAGVPLVPIACKTDFAMVGRVIKDLGPIDPSRDVRYWIGQPLPPTLPQRELMEKSTGFIGNALSGIY